VGILATVTMDVVAVMALWLGIAARGRAEPVLILIRRWIGYLLRGKFRHTDILQTPPLRRELVLGLVAHYSIGIVLTLLYLGLLVVAHAKPTALSAILYGRATTVFPSFLMFPSQGMGWLGRCRPIFSAISTGDFRLKIEGRACNRESEIDNQECRSGKFCLPKTDPAANGQVPLLNPFSDGLRSSWIISCAFPGQNSALAWIQLSVCFPESAT
jgi:Protein of unknown function (DUF2938)